uniref:Transcription factor domain-containing protein n=1 Tax=Bionectria ochroleuca TaxID=29856 RepID=A0A8H7KBG9_BIOOC
MSTTLSPDEFVLDPGYLAFQEELRCLIFHTAQTAAPSREGSPGLGIPPDGTSFSPEQQQETQAQVKAILSTGRHVEYLKNYVAEVAPWLDMFDSSRTFTIQVPNLAQRCPALLYAILALSARQIERKEGKQHSFDSLELYQEAIRLLNPLLQAKDLAIIPICVILCCLEMMSASPHDWRKHLEGCAALFDAFGVNGFSGGMLQAVFWCYARMGHPRQHGQLALPGSPQFQAAHLFREHASPDMHANHAVFLCAQVCELIADRTRFVELGDRTNGCDAPCFERRWVALWDSLQAWLVDAQPFPQILFVHWAGISSNQLYHTACILLLGYAPAGLRLQDPGHVGSAVWHAKCICGISFTNPHRGCLNNAIQPLWIAGRLLSHRSEHVLIAKLIRSIENMTGWATCWRISDLEVAWGHAVPRSPRRVLK